MCADAHHDYDMSVDPDDPEDQQESKRGCRNTGSLGAHAQPYHQPSVEKRLSSLVSPSPGYNFEFAVYPSFYILFY